MSHFTTIKTQIKDIAALKAAVTELGLALVQDEEARGYKQNRMKADYIIRLKGPYDIAVNRQPDGLFGLTADFWDGHVEKEAGKGFARLMHLYAVHKATMLARGKGYMVRRVPHGNDSVKLVVASA